MKTEDIVRIRDYTNQQVELVVETAYFSKLLFIARAIRVEYLQPTNGKLKVLSPSLTGLGFRDILNKRPFLTEKAKPD